MTFAELWPEQVVLHALVERRTADSASSPDLGQWSCIDESGTAYVTRRAGFKLRDRYWSIELVLAPGVPSSGGRLAVRIPAIQAQGTVVIGPTADDA